MLFFQIQFQSKDMGFRFNAQLGPLKATAHFGGQSIAGQSAINTRQP